MPRCPFRCWFNASMQARKEGRAVVRTGCLSWGFRCSFIWSVATSSTEGLASKVLVGDLEVTLPTVWTCLVLVLIILKLAFLGNASTSATGEALVSSYSADGVAILDLASGSTSDVAATSTGSTSCSSSGSFFVLYLGLSVRFVIMLLILYIVKRSSRSLFWYSTTGSW